MGVSNLVRLAAALGFMTLAASSMAAAAPAPLQAYGKLPTLEKVALSPDGTKMAFVRTVQNARYLAVMSLETGKVIGAGRLGETKLRDLSWADDDHLLIGVSTTQAVFGLIGPRHEWSELLVYQISTRKLRPYPQFQHDLNNMNVIVGEPMVRHIGNDTVLFITGIYADDVTKLALFKVNLRTGVQNVARLGSEATRGWLLDQGGEVVAEDSYFERDRRWEMKYRHDGRWLTTAAVHEPIDVPAMIGWGPSADSVLVATQQDGDPVWKLLSLKDGTFGPRMESADGLSEVLEDPATHLMIGGVSLDDYPSYVFFDATLRSRWHSVVQAFDREHVELTSASRDLTRFVVLVQGPTHGYQYQLVDLRKARAIPVGNVYDDISQVLEVRSISYKAADGLQLHGYLTLPAGLPASKLPLVVFPHGGPEARDTAQFDWWAQAMASVGYAVLQPNFRGSAGTWSLVSAGFGEWGRRMQTDLSDGVRYLAKEGIVDPARVCIVGASYGGYAALAGVTLDPGVYRCAASIAGISDVTRFLKFVDTRDAYGSHVARRYWDRYMGISGHNDPAVDNISPVMHIDRITVPVLLIHGKDDTVVPFEQSEMMLNAMRKANKPVELVTLKKEDHWLSRGETRLQTLQSTVDFLRANNPPD